METLLYYGRLSGYEDKTANAEQWNDLRRQVPLQRALLADDEALGRFLAYVMTNEIEPSLDSRLREAFERGLIQLVIECHHSGHEYAFVKVIENDGGEDGGPMVSLDEDLIGVCLSCGIRRMDEGYEHFMRDGRDYPEEHYRPRLAFSGTWFFRFAGGLWCEAAVDQELGLAQMVAERQERRDSRLA